MALRALQPRVRVRQREHRMIEVRGIPSRGRVAVCAIRSSEHRTRSGVDGIVRLLPRRKVAACCAAGCRCSDELVVDVALRAGHTYVFPSQREFRQVVVELRV